MRRVAVLGGVRIPFCRSHTAYAELSKPSSYVKPMTYGAVAPGLFDAIVANRAPRNPVPHPVHNQPVSGSKA